ncbi:hypothetical protein [Martelella sp. AD-3]|uniref:hypothetical protein n=1 Tax=Martelella sp. AD-3 TaxID=686597 RepID=UPI000464C552|nr:hypothetical protein [Martelella sp. AD-3]AMM83073.1 hypothetical protein AZF01_00760 [Martelella sp. AD-3]
MTRRLFRVLPAVLLLGGAFLLGRFLILSPGHRAALIDGPVTGIVWQVDDATAKPEGEWQRLGADHLLIQWILVDGIGFARGTGGKAPTQMPDWRRIAKEPWARHVTLGLAGDFDEKKARENALQLARTSAAIAGKKPPLAVEGYYFPVEVDPTWKEAAEVMPKALALLPRPLWISVYDNSNIGGEALADWLSTWLPADVGVFFQDGAGVAARSPQTARDYADALSARLGKDRLRVIAEAFRPLPQGGFRPATVQELMPQIALMEGYALYLFDGPHYLDDTLVDALVKRIDERD